MTTDSDLAKVALDKNLRAKGYIPAAEIAAKFGIHINSVYRWIAEKEVTSVKIGNKRYVMRDSLVKKVGVVAAEAVGLLAPASPGGKKRSQVADIDIEIET